MGMSETETQFDDRYLSDGFLKALWGDFALFLFTNPLDRQFWHGHEDIGGFALYYKRSPFFIDTGRFSYAAAEGSWAEPCAHNAVLVDGMGPVTRRTGRYIKEYLKDCTAHLRIISEGIIEIQMPGYSRITPGLGLLRRFQMTRDGLTIEDFLSGEGEHRVQTYFHFRAESCSVEGGKAELRRKGALFLISAEETDAVLQLDHHKPFSNLGWRCEEYGRRTPSYTIRHERRARLPLASRYRIEVMQPPCAA